MKTIKKILLTVTLIIGAIYYGNAQEVGLRFGDVSAGSVAIDVIFSTNNFERLHGDISFGDGVAADLLWDFVNRPLNYEAINWYMGVGPYLGIIDGGSDFNLGLAFEIGLEYRFRDAPIALGCDYRPSLEIIDETRGHFGGFGLNIRYIFGEY